MALPLNAVKPEGSRIVRAVIALDATSLADVLHVRIPSFGNAISEVAAWPPIEPLPSKGDVCVVAYDDGGVPLVIGWERPPTDPVLAALPSTPFDGQAISFQTATMAAQGALWRLRYNAASVSAYKWEFIGGCGLAARVDTQESTTSAAWVDLATVGPAAVAPLAGDYEVAFGCWMLNNGAGGLGKWAMTTLNLGAGAEESAAVISSFSTSNVWYTGTRVIRRTVASALATVKMQYAAQAGTAIFQYRELVLRPVRVG